MNKQRIIIFVVVTLIVSYFIFITEDDFCNDKMSHYVRPMILKGIVTDKYIDTTNHSLPRIILNTNVSNREIITAYDLKNFDSLYYYIEVGDSIFKKAGDSIFHIKRDTVIEKFAIGCY